MLIDNARISAECPKCKFQNTFTMKQTRLCDMIICRGCKSNVRLDDPMNECRNAARRTERAIAKLRGSLKNLNLTLKIKL